jgi:hypothetical protein
MDRRLEQAGPDVGEAHLRLQVRIVRGELQGRLEIGPGPIRRMGGEIELAPPRQRLGVIGLPLQRLVQIRHRQHRLPGAQPRHGPRSIERPVFRLELYGAVVVGDGRRQVAPRGIGGGAPGELRPRLWLPRDGPSARRSSRGRRRRRLRTALRRLLWARLVQAEHRPAVVGEIDLLLAVGDQDAVRQEEVGPQQHVAARQVQIGHPQPRVLDLLVADLEAGEGRQEVLQALAVDAVADPTTGHTGRVDTDTRPRRGVAAHHGQRRAGIEHHPDRMIVDLRVGDHLEQGVGGIHDLQARERHPRRPVGEVGVKPAARRFEVPDDAVGEVVLHVERTHQVLADVADHAVADPAEQDEVHLAKSHAGEAEALRRDSPEVALRATGPLHHHAEGRDRRLHPVLGDGVGGHPAEEGARIHQELGVHAVDLGHHGGPKALHGHRNFSEFLELAGGVGDARRAQRDD